MGWGKYLALCIVLVAFRAGASTHGGLCSMDTSTSANLPYATCFFPTCPTGANCFPPTIDKTSATIAYQAPFISWRDICPDKTVQGACWEVHMDFDLHVGAQSPNGIAYIGVEVSKEVNNQRVRNLYWGKADTRDPQGRYGLTTTLIAYVPPGQRMMLEVHQLCAQDATNNQGCIIPLGSQILTN